MYIIIVTYFSTLSVMSLDTGGIKALRALRVLRPLKFIAGCRREYSILTGFVLYEDLRLISSYEFPRQKKFHRILGRETENLCHKSLPIIRKLQNFPKILIT